VSRTDDSPVPDYARLTDLSGRGYVVLGAGQGMGRQAAHALAACGGRVVCVDLDADLAGDVAGEVGGLPWSGDVTRRADIEALVGFATGQLGRLDGLVDIVGMSTFVPLLEIDDDLWASQFDICLRHAFLAMQVAGRAMAAGGGGVMAFVASISGLSAATGHAAYGAAKAGLISLVRSAATELGPLGIRVNAIAPGLTLTPRISARLTEEQKEASAAASPTRRLNLPEDMARALLFFVSDLSRGVNGQVLPVDGGASITFPLRR